MNTVIVYGSLINKGELSQHEFPLDNIYPVIVRGFKRMFCQEPSWRAGQGEERAVLNAVSSHEHWLNGLLISGLCDDFLVKLDERERGYQRLKVNPACLQKYESPYTIQNAQHIYMYTGKMANQSYSILPNTSYLSICLEGANQWGAVFYNHFLDSTFVKHNILLRAYLE